MGRQKITIRSADQPQTSPFTSSLQLEPAPSCAMDDATDASDAKENASLKSFKRDQQKCNNCYKSGLEVTLKNCARCKAARYCSRECQIAHWKTHKEICNKNAAHAEALQSPFNLLNLIPLPDGMSLADLDRRLEKWIKFHNSTLMAACIHALALPRDITRAKTHILRILVTPRTDHGGLPAKFFRIRDAMVPSMEEAMSFRDPWRESLEDLAKLREESESMKRGTVAAAAIECPPLGVQMVPFGSVRDLFRLRILPNWKDILIADIENGKKFTKFGGR